MMDWKMTLEELAAGSEGRVLSWHKREFSGIGTDTRADLSGQVFVALKGETFDAHDFLSKAVDSGAAALLVHAAPPAELLDRVTVVRVKDTLQGIQLLGNFWRHKVRARVLGITGTNGKTTTKEFAAAIIGSCRRVHYSKGSFNNHWGVPMSLLAMNPSHQVAIIEMGMNHPGEITELAKIAEPDVVVVTMVGRGHLEGLGSIEGVARAKQEIYDTAHSSSQLIFNLDNAHTRMMYELFAPRIGKDRMILFSGSMAKASPLVDVALEIVSLQPESMRIRGRIRGVEDEVSVPVFGAQNLTNLMAASALSLAAGLSPEEIWRALPECRTVWGRNQWVKLPSGAKVLFDGYNANPESMRAAIENFSQLQVTGRKFAILAEMREMGTHALDVHREMGELAGRAGFSGVCFFGPSKAAFEAGIKASDFSENLIVSDSYENILAPRMLPVLSHNDIVLMKGSRGMALEKVLLDLKPVDFQIKK